MCLLVLTPLVLVSVALCGEGACYYFSRDQLLIATGLIGLCVFLVLLYVLWVALSVRYHFHRWREWRKKKQIVHVIVSDTKLKEKMKQKGKQQQETGVNEEQMNLFALITLHVSTLRKLYLNGYIMFKKLFKQVFAAYDRRFRFNTVNMCGR